MWGALIAFGIKVFGTVNGWFKYRETKAHERLGRQDERLRAMEGNVEASMEMRRIEDETSRLDDDARGDALRRYVRHGDNGDK